MVDSLPVQGKCSYAAARAVARALIALDIKISGITTDSGGGGVLDSMAENLDGLGVAERQFEGGEKSCRSFAVAACS